LAAAGERFLKALRAGMERVGDLMPLGCGIGGYAHSSAEPKERIPNTLAALQARLAQLTPPQTDIAALLAETRRTAFAEVGDVRFDGDTATVAVQIMQGGKVVGAQTLALTREERERFRKLQGQAARLRELQAQLGEREDAYKKATTKGERRNHPDEELRAQSEEIIRLRDEAALQEAVLRSAQTEAFSELLATHQSEMGAGVRYQPFYVEDFAGGWETINALADFTRSLRHFDNVETILRQPELQASLRTFAEELNAFVRRSEAALKAATDLATREHEELNKRLIELKDCAWRISEEVLKNVDRLLEILAEKDLRQVSPLTLREAMQTTLVLNEIDRLEFRGRDSCGTAKMIRFPNRAAYQAFLDALTPEEQAEFAARQNTPLFPSGAIRVREAAAGEVILTFVHKYASVIGDFGENTARIRQAIEQDALFQKAIASAHQLCPGIAHTRWASVGIINEQNCHPVDSTILRQGQPYTLTLPPDSPYGAGAAHVFACLNGDIMEYPALREELKASGEFALPGEITTDTKIIPVRVQHYLAAGCDLEEAFRRAAADFAGSSYAIAMQCDLEPHKLFVALDGSGQAAYIGLSPNGPVVASEIYGFVEHTQRYLQVQPGQVFVINQDEVGPGELSGITGMYHDGTRFQVFPADVQTTEITSRDIDKRGFDHFLRKELEEAMESFEKTTRGKIGLREEEGRKKPVINLGPEIVPPRMLEKVRTKQYRTIICSGMGTAAAAAYGFAEQMARDLAPQGQPEYEYDPAGNIRAIRVEWVTLRVYADIATEVSGFQLKDDMSDTLLIFVTQSGTTADTLSALDRAKERNADFICIVNRRDSDITSRVVPGQDGCFYTSDGRDPEVAVASTKAYYAQVAAGKILSLAFAQALGTKSDEEMVVEIEELLALPGKMETVLREIDPWIEQVAQVATTRKEYGIAASGPNRSGAREGRIKIAELTHKAVSEDHLEDIKHIYLSARPMLLLLLAGLPDELVTDSAQEVAYFTAHNAAPVVIASESQTEPFRDQAYAIIAIPDTRTEVASLILNVLCAHLFCYHSCRAINKGSQKLAQASNELGLAIAAQRALGRSDEDILAEAGFRALASKNFALWLTELDHQLFEASLGARQTARLTVLFQAVAEGAGERARQLGLVEPDESVLDVFLGHIDGAVKETARYIDAIREQAKTVTVGAKRVEQKSDKVTR